MTNLADKVVLHPVRHPSAPWIITHWKAVKVSA